MCVGGSNDHVVGCVLASKLRLQNIHKTIQDQVLSVWFVGLRFAAEHVVSCVMASKLRLQLRTSGSL
jgi:hypothetical protein